MNTQVGQRSTVLDVVGTNEYKTSETRVRRSSSGQLI